MNETEVLLSALIGGLGGLVRSAVGLLKAMASKRKILWMYWLITMFVSLLIGLFSGIIFSFDYRLSALAGYAGTDLLEGIYKTFKVGKFYIPPKK